MPFCPKCEQEYRAGFDRCADCSVDLVTTLVTPESVKQEEERYAEDLFAVDEEDIAWFCTNCLNEFVAGSRQCGPCGAAVTQATYEAYDRALGSGTLDAYRGARGPEATPGLVVARTYSNPADAAWVVASLHEMGVSAEIGNDAMDEFDDPSVVGIYAPPEEVDSAKLLIDDDGGGDDDFAPADADPYDVLLRNAQAYRDIGKLRHALKLGQEAIEMKPQRAAAFVVVGDVLGEMGHFARAAEAFEAVLVSEPQHAQSRLFYAVFSMIDADGEATFKGERLARPIDVLASFVRDFPRSTPAGKLLFEARHTRGDKEAARSTYQDLERLNPRLFNQGLMAELAAHYA